MMKIFLRVFLVPLTLSSTVAGSIALANVKAELPTADDGKRVLQCLITFGEIQEISVYSMSNGTFKITTLSKVGAAQAYEMPSKQWAIGKVEVPCLHDEKKSCGEVYANGHFWSYDFGSTVGDCR